MFLIALLTLNSPLVLDARAADDDYEDLDGEKSGKRRPAASTEEEEGDPARPQREEVVREIVRGRYFKSSVGEGLYLLNYGYKPQVQDWIVGPGVVVAFTFGQDFVDNEKNSVAYEITFNTGVHNGLNWKTNSQAIQQGLLPPSAAAQGDTRTFEFLGAIEYSIYPTRRVGLGLRAGAGVMLAPLEMHPVAFEEDVIPEFGNALPMHRQAHPVVFAGPTLEYYTKLSHFSVGLDIDVGYYIGWDLGVTGTGFFKYTL